MEDITPEQQETLTKFKTVIADVRNSTHDDHHLLKWLKARSFNIKRAEDMYRQSMAWRQEIGADTILETYKPSEVLTKYYPGGICGTDKEARPIWIDPLGRGDIKGIIYSTKKSDIIKFHVYRLEKLYAGFRRRSKAEGRQIDQCSHIIDMDGFGPKIFWKPALDLYIEVLQILEKNYPETLKRTYLINAPRIFHMGWNILKTFLDKDTAKKFRFLGANSAQTLLEVIDADQLPEHYGGTRCDPDGNGKCITEVCYGGDVPKEMYLSTEDIFPSDSPREEENLGRGGSLTLGFSIPNSDHVIRYVFLVSHGSIDYGVYGQTSGENIVYDVGKMNADGCDVRKLDVIKPVTTIECSRVAEDGYIFFEKPGIYYIQFRNTSRMWRKTLTYVMDIVTLDEGKLLQSPVLNVVRSREEEHTDL